MFSLRLVLRILLRFIFNREHKHAHLSLKVHPYEQGMLNTINRAELVALLIALRHCRPGVTESIAIDS